MEKIIIMIKGNEILFHTNLGVSVDISSTVPLHKLMSKHGLILPIDSRSFTVARLLNWFIPKKENLSLDFISGIDFKKMQEKSAMLLLTKTKEIFTVYSVDISTGTYLVNNLYHDIDNPHIEDNVWYGIGLESGSDDILNTALNTTDTLDEAYSVVCKTYPFFFKNSARIYNLSELFKWISECNEEVGVTPYPGKVRKPEYVEDVTVSQEIPPNPVSE